MSAIYSLKLFIPHATSNTITNIFEYIMLLIFGVAFLYLVYIFCSSQRKNKQLLSAIKECSDNPVRSICPVKHPVFEQYYSNFVWENEQAFSTSSPDEYFSDEILIKPLCKSKIIPFLVTMLTGIGVLGTFLGLTIGLADLDILSENQNALKMGMDSMVRNASTAFVTSVWGVGTSLLLGLIFRIFQHIAGIPCEKIREALRQKFPVYSPVDTFIEDVRENLKDAKDTLAGLAEKIGNEMQKTIGPAIGNAIGPAINKLVEATKNLNQKSSEQTESKLETLLEKFIDVISSAGTEQRESIATTTEEFKNTLKDNSTAMKAFLETLKTQQQTLAIGAETRNNTLIDSLNDMLSKQQQNVDSLNIGLDASVQSGTTLIKQVESLHGALGENLQKLQELSISFEKMCSAIQSASSSMESMGNGLNDTMQKVSRSVADSVESVNGLTETNRRVGTEFSQSTAALQNTAAALGTSAASFTKTAEATSTQYSQLAGQYRNMQQELQTIMNAYAEQVKQMMDGYAEQVKNMLENYAKQVQDQTAERLRKWDTETQNFCNSMTDVVSAMAQVVDEMELRK